MQNKITRSGNVNPEQMSVIEAGVPGEVMIYHISLTCNLPSNDAIQDIAMTWFDKECQLIEKCDAIKNIVVLKSYKQTDC